MGTVKDLAEALTEKLEDIGRHPTISFLQFRGKKGEDPNDYCMKVEDYFAMFDRKRGFWKPCLRKLEDRLAP